MVNKTLLRAVRLWNMWPCGIRTTKLIDTDGHNFIAVRESYTIYIMGGGAKRAVDFFCFRKIK